jgi:thymidine kinase
MATAEYVTKVHAVHAHWNLANSFRKTDNEKLLLGETEEYEPLSRAAYYHAMRKDQEGNKNFPSVTERDLRRRRRLNEI